MVVTIVDIIVGDANGLSSSNKVLLDSKGKLRVTQNVDSTLGEKYLCPCEGVDINDMGTHKLMSSNLPVPKFMSCTL